MSRPATAAHSSSRTHSVDSRASRRRSVSATLAGIWAGWCHEPWAGSSRVSSLTKNGLPPLRCHSCGGDLRRKARPGQVPGQRPDVVRGEPGQRQLLSLPGDLEQLRGRLGVPVRAEQQHTAPRPGRGRGTPATAATARPPSAGRRAPRARAGPAARPAEAPRDRLEQAELGVGRGAGAHRLRRSPEAGCSSQPASPRSAAGGRWPAAPGPGPVRRRSVALPAEPAQHERRPARPRRISSASTARLADARLAADQQAPPGAAASASSEHRAGRGQRRLPADRAGRPDSWRHHGRSGSQLQAPGSSAPATSSRRTRPNPASGRRVPAAAARRPAPRAAPTTWPSAGTPRSACTPASETA